MQKNKEIKRLDKGVFTFLGKSFKATVSCILKNGKLRIKNDADGSIIDNVTKTEWKKQNAKK